LFDLHRKKCHSHAAATAAQKWQLQSKATTKGRGQLLAVFRQYKPNNSFIGRTSGNKFQNKRANMAEHKYIRAQK